MVAVDARRNEFGDPSSSTLTHFLIQGVLYHVLAAEDDVERNSLQQQTGRFVRYTMAGAWGGRPVSVQQYAGYTS